MSMCFSLRGVVVNQVEEFRLNLDGPYRTLTTLNAEILLRCIKDNKLLSAISGDNARIAVDGQWILYALRRKYGSVNVAKNSGSDLIYSVVKDCVSSEQNVLLLGAAEDSNLTAVEKLRGLNNTDQYIYGFSPPYSSYPFTDNFNQTVRSKIETVKPKVLVMAFGVPKQEYWAKENRDFLESIGVKYVMFFGGAIDMVAGKYKRSPKVLTNWGMEGVYRLILQPRRIKRYYKLLKLIPMIIFNRL